MNHADSNAQAFFFFRGDHIVPNFEEIWPSKKGKNSAPKRGLEYYYDAMTNGPELSGDFTNSRNFCCLLVQLLTWCRIGVILRTVCFVGRVSVSPPVEVGFAIFACLFHIFL